MFVYALPGASATLAGRPGGRQDRRREGGHGRRRCRRVGCGRPAGISQRVALRAEGDAAGHVYHDFASGVRDDRPGLDSCVRALRTGDVLVVWKLDRLGRNLAHLVNTVQDLSARGVGLRVLTGKARRSTPPPPPGDSCSASSRRWPSSSES